MKSTRNVLSLLLIMKNIKRHLRPFIVPLLWIFIVSGCGGGSSGGSSSVSPTPPPVLTSVSPNTVIPGGAGFTLTVTGSNFTTMSTVDWNGAARQTTFVSSTQLTAQIAASDIANGGTASVTVVGGGNTSGALSVVITAINTSVQQVSPGGATLKSANYTIIGTVAPGPDNTAATSLHYKLQGGLTGAGESKQ